MRRDVAVNELQRLSMLIGEMVRRCEPLKRIQQYATDERPRQPVAVLGRSTEKGAEVVTLDVLHDEEVAVAWAVADV